MPHTNMELEQLESVSISIDGLITCYLFSQGLFTWSFDMVLYSDSSVYRVLLGE